MKPTALRGSSSWPIAKRCWSRRVPPFDPGWSVFAPVDLRCSHDLEFLALNVPRRRRARAVDVMTDGQSRRARRRLCCWRSNCSTERSSATAPRPRERSAPRPTRQARPPETAPVVRLAVVSDESHPLAAPRVWVYYVTERSKGRTPTAAEPDPGRCDPTTTAAKWCGGGRRGHSARRVERRNPIDRPAGLKPAYASSDDVVV